MAKKSRFPSALGGSSGGKKPVEIRVRGNLNPYTIQSSKGEPIPSKMAGKPVMVG